MRLTLILLTILLTASSGIAADSVDEMAEKYESLKRDGLLSLHKRHYEELLKVRERAMTDRSLALANKADTKIEILKLDPSVSWVVEKWLFGSNKWSGTRDFRADGLGKWKVIGNDLIVEYANGASATFHLPVRGRKLTGKSEKGALITATKVEKKP